MKALKRMNEALPELVGGILGYGLVVFGAAILFVQDKMQFTIGLVCGIACAVFMAIHIAMVLNDSVLAGGGAYKLLAAKSVFRYLVVAAVFFLLAYLKVGDVIWAFVGAMGLKISAYIQQFKRQKIVKENKNG
ncbi:MAG: hypothetical protein IJ679_00505 [Lachnospiraceae bacterium]|nr:hypothetical protein [Lachnospiraceae bacterium]